MTNFNLAISVRPFVNFKRMIFLCLLNQISTGAYVIYFFHKIELFNPQKVKLFFSPSKGEIVGESIKVLFASKYFICGYRKWAYFNPLITCPELFAKTFFWTFCRLILQHEACLSFPLALHFTTFLLGHAQNLRQVSKIFIIYLLYVWQVQNDFWSCRMASNFWCTSQVKQVNIWNCCS